MKAAILALSLLLPATASAAIYKCEAGGRTTYQSTPCPAGAAQEDASHLQHSQRMYSSGNRYERAPDDYMNEYRQLQQRRSFEYNRQLQKAESQRKRDRMLNEARRHQEKEARAKAERDRRWREDKIRRKARNNGDYEYWDVNIR